jgi:hypothetical protein
MHTLFHCFSYDGRESTLVLILEMPITDPNQHTSTLIQVMLLLMLPLLLSQCLLIIVLTILENACVFVGLLPPRLRMSYRTQLYEYAERTDGLVTRRLVRPGVGLHTQETTNMSPCPVAA